ncbi:MAG: hypothetical protein ACKV2T_17750 [Kofleriaceae bacterium]
MKEIQTLINLDPSEAPLVSCYLARDHAAAATLTTAFEARCRDVRSFHTNADRPLLDSAFQKIREYLETELRTSTRGIAAFSRAGEQPFFLARQFDVSLPDHISVNYTPDVYHLVELKDTYDRYVVLITSESRARILEVNLGEVTREAWTKQPKLRERVGSAWTHAHYQNHRRDRGQQFLQEKLALIDKLMSAGGHTHLILAGPPNLTAPLRERLAPHHRAKLVDVVELSPEAAGEEVVAATLSSLITIEQEESQNTVNELMQALWRDGLAVAGARRSLEAMWRDQADVLVLAAEYTSGPAWVCRDCDWVEATTRQPEECAQCEAPSPHAADMKEALVQLAEKKRVEIEITRNSDELMRIGGVGCLLRYELDSHWDFGGEG